jgi:hypothetical protein
MSTKILATTAALALFAVPALGAQAQPGPRTESPGKSQGKGKRTGQKNKPRGRCARKHARAFVAKGTLVSFIPTADTADAATAGELTVNVVSGNRHSRGHRGEQSFALTDERVSFRGVTDTNATGVGFDDVVAGDRVMLVGKLLTPKRRCAAAAPTVDLRRVKVSRPEPEPAPQL